MAAVLAAIMTFLSMACTDDNVAYIQFRTVSPEGLLDRDTLHFTVDSLPADGTYTTYLCLRTNTEYPYRNVSFLVAQTVISKGTASKTRQRQAITSTVYSETNKSLWTGTARYSAELPVTTSRLHQGDSLVIDVRHNMRRETMPGITDIGIKVVKAIVPGASASGS